MTVARFAVSFDPDLAQEIRRAAGDEPLSAWLADAARQKLRARRLLDLVGEWEEVHGTISEVELRAVERRQRGAHAGRRKR